MVDPVERHVSGAVPLGGPTLDEFAFPRVKQGALRLLEILRPEVSNSWLGKPSGLGFRPDLPA